MRTTRSTRRNHILSSLIGTALMLPVQEGSLLWGTWQRVILVEAASSRALSSVRKRVAEPAVAAMNFPAGLIRRVRMLVTFCTPQVFRNRFELAFAFHFH